MALTTLAEVKTYLGITGTEDDALLTSLIDRAGKLIKNYTHRTLESTTFRQRYDGKRSRDLVLKEYPVISIDYISIGTNSAFSLINVNSDAYRAGVTVNETQMILEVYGGANDGTETITLSGYSTLSALETYVNALGTGWTMDVAVSDYDDYDSAELLPTGRLECFNSYAYPQIPDEPLEKFFVYYDEGIVRLPIIPSDSPNNVIIKYVAGYATIPDDLEQACIAMISYLYNSRGKDFSLKSEKLGDYSYTLADSLSGGSNAFPMDVQILLMDYVKKTSYVA